MLRKLWSNQMLGLLAMFGLAMGAALYWTPPAQAQGKGKETPPPPPPKVVAVRAGKLFDPKSGTLLANQVVLITGDRITEVGPASRVQIPAGVQVVDLSRATV